jgi:hypothetical protein
LNLFLLASPKIGACQNPGRWAKVLIGQYEPIDFAFSDSLHGILLCKGAYRGPDYLVSFETSDGGRSWGQPFVSTAKTYGVSGVWPPNGFQSLEPGTATFDDYFSWEEELSINSDTITNLIVKRPYLLEIFGLKMYTVRDGYRYVCKIDSTGVLANESYMIVTHDGWKSYDSAGRFLNHWVDDASILDSNNIWVAHLDTLFHYFDGQWHAVAPLAPKVRPTTPRSYYGFLYLECRPVESEGRQEIYAVGGDSTSDFYYSSDGGNTWERHGALGGRISGIAATAPNTVWCFVGNALAYDWAHKYSNLQRYSQYADTICYSSDHGNSWSVDSTSFSGAAMMQMHWVDPRHGFVSTVEFGDTCFMYRYEAPPVAAVGTQLPRASALKILTSPVMQQLAFDYTDAEGVSNIRVFDVLGRTRLSEQRAIAAEQPVRIDASALTSGYYILSVSNGKRTTSQGFIRQ